jgi:hypothetical protein
MQRRRREPQGSECFLTESTAPSYVRRGDPLGFRAVADHYADVLVPGLSNRTHDARWLTLLCWMLVQVRDARLAAGLATDTRTPAQRREIYDWIRPLELMWVEQAVRSADDRRALDGRQLPGRNAVWTHVHGRPGLHFGLSADQFARYRYTGPHAAYRALLAHLPGLSVGGDGYSPGPVAEQLACLIRNPFGRPTATALRASTAPDVYWARVFSSHARRVGTSRPWLPGSRLSPEERRLLRPLLFGAGESGARRRDVAVMAAGSTAARHADLVALLARKLPGGTGSGLKMLPAFSTLADAGVDAMLAVWRLFQARRVVRLELDTILRNEDCNRSLRALAPAADAWRASRRSAGVPHFPTVEAFARELRGATTADGGLRCLVAHHEGHGGGRRWFRLDRGALVRDAGLSGQDSSYYRFRLWPLCRLAVQLGVISTMPRALSQDASEGLRGSREDLA